MYASRTCDAVHLPAAICSTISVADKKKSHHIVRIMTNVLISTCRVQKGVVSAAIIWRSQGKRLVSCRMLRRNIGLALYTCSVPHSLIPDPPSTACLMRPLVSLLARDIPRPFRNFMQTNLGSRDARRVLLSTSQSENSD